MEEKRLRKLSGIVSQLNEVAEIPSLKKIQNTLVKMERFLKEVERDENRGALEENTFAEGYISAMEVWLKLLSKEFPGLRNRLK